MSTSTETKRVARAAERAARARAELEQSMRYAYTAGESLRTIADAAGVSHEQVRKIVSQP